MRLGADERVVEEDEGRKEEEGCSETLLPAHLNSLIKCDTIPMLL